MGKTRFKIKKKELYLAVFIVLIMFQQPLQGKLSVFSYLDELPALLAIAISGVFSGRITVRKKNAGLIRALLCFVLSGLLGNILFRYQPLKYVVIDLFTNLKFILTLCFSLRFFSNGIRGYDRLPGVLSALSGLLFLLFLADRLFGLYGGEVRYGIRAAALFFGHPQYLAGFCVCLIAGLSLYGPGRYWRPIVLDLIMTAFTLRAKAFASVTAFGCLAFIVYALRSQIKFRRYVLLAGLSVLVAWPQISYYFITLAGASARSVILRTSFQILIDYFPIGTGFGTYASHSAAAHYSPVYYKYGFEAIYELRNAATGTFFDDQFWPIIIGQTGFIGLASYVSYLVILLKRVRLMASTNKNAYFASMFLFLYLLIGTMSDPGFNNTIAVPLALMLGLAFNTCRSARTRMVEQA